MKATLVLIFAGTALFWNTSEAATIPNGRSNRTAPMEFDVRTGEWKPAAAKPVVKTYPKNEMLESQGYKPGKTPWTWQRVAMQPLRFLVIAAKIPLLPAGYVGYNAYALSYNVRGYDVDYLDLAEGLEKFDPGPAIDADLELIYARKRAKEEAQPAPFKSELRINRATVPVTDRKSASTDSKRSELNVPFTASAKSNAAKPAPRVVAENNRPEPAESKVLANRR